MIPDGLKFLPAFSSSSVLRVERANCCYCGLDFSIRVDGTISGCPSIRANYDQGNIYRDDFMQVWNERFKLFRDRIWARQGVCASVPCSVTVWVTGCIFMMNRESF